MLYNPNSKTDWAVGDICIIHISWSDMLMEGIIESVRTENGMTVYRIKTKEITGTWDALAEHLFENMDDAKAAFNNVEEQRIKKYEALMPDVEGLVRFAALYNVHPCEEYTDTAAITAYKNRAKALLGIDLDA